MDRSLDEFEKARRHSHKVRILKIMLPVAGALVVVILIAMLLVNSLGSEDIDIARISVGDGKLVMENPELNGVDANRRPYDLKAVRAVQDVSNPAQVMLDAIQANLPLDDETVARVTAGNGLYDAEARTLRLDELVQVETTSGIRIELENADIDIGEGRLATGRPVVATSPQADIRSDSLLVEDNGNRIVFEGRVRMKLNPAELRKLPDE